MLRRGVDIIHSLGCQSSPTDHAGHHRDSDDGHSDYQVDHFDDRRAFTHITARLYEYYRPFCSVVYLNPFSCSNSARVRYSIGRLVYLASPRSIDD